MHPLESYRQDNSLTLAALGELLGVPASTIHGWIHGRHRISFESAMKINRVTGLPVTDLTAAHRPDGQHPLALWRWVNGLSQRRAGQLFGCDRSSVSLWEAWKRHPTGETMAAIEFHTGLCARDFIKPREEGR